MSHSFHEPGEVPTAGTDINNIGDWVALILADPRTLNQTVFVWEAQATQKELYKLAAAKGVDVEELNKVVTRVCVYSWNWHAKSALAPFIVLLSGSRR